MTQDVIVERDGRIGTLRLNRPKALNALNHSMCKTLSEALLAWRTDPAVDLVMIEHEEGRAFCAGGDIRVIRESGMTDGREARRFFDLEYRMNHLLFSYPRPVISFMDGITMGGGVGLALPAKWRVATERTLFAMPETAIGLVPDVGGGWFLSRLPARLGQYLGTTGARLDGADCVALGLATHYVPSDRLSELKAKLKEAPAAVGAVLAEAAAVPPTSRLMEHASAISELFASDTLEDILLALQHDGSDFGVETLKTLLFRSPQSLKVTLRLLAEGLFRTDFADEMRTEYRLVSRICQRPDFIEGVRAVIVDKTNDAAWNPASPQDVTDALLDGLFAPLPSDQEWSPFPDLSGDIS